MSVFKPKMYLKNVFDINYDNLKNVGIKYLIFDLDNTLGLVNEVVCSEKVRVFINNLSNDFKIIIASNNNYERVAKFVDNLKVSIIPFAMKPSRKIYQYMKKNFTSNMQEVCIIGDQIVTDILSGNRFGMMSILVDPLGEKDLKITSFNRFLEKNIMKNINLKRGEYYEKN